MGSAVTLWVTPVSNLAGVARHIIDVARVGLPGWHLEVACPAGPLHDELAALGVTVHTLDVEDTFGAVRSLRETIVQLKPRIVHSHLAKADLLVWMATAGLPVTLVTTEHHISPDRYIFHPNHAEAWAMEAVHAVRLRRFAAAIAVSNSTRRDMISRWHASLPIHVILNGVDRPKPPRREPGLRLLSLTRLSPEKNLTATIDTFARVRESHPEATLTLAGTGPQADELRAYAEQRGLDVSFPGFLDAAEAMASHDVLVQPSKSDNCSYTLLDAVAQGMGVAASSIGGNPEILPERCIGDDPARLAEISVRQGLDLAERPQLDVDVPTVSEMAGRIVDVYRSVVTAAERGRPRPLESRPTEGPRATVLLPYYKAAADLPAQLEALANQVDAPTFEVLISDNEGSTELPDLIAPFRERFAIRVVDTSSGKGLTRALQGALPHARGEWLVRCDADDVADLGWLAGFAQHFDETGVLLAGHNRVDEINPEPLWRIVMGLGEDEPVEAPVLLTPMVHLSYLPFGFGCNLAIRTADCRRIGGWDTAMTGASDDVEFCWRAQERGLTLVEVPQALMHYRLRRTPRALFRQKRGYTRSQVELWAASKGLGRPVQDMSMRWALTETAKLVPEFLASRPDGSFPRFAYHAGSILGNLEGQIWYRIVQGARRRRGILR